MEVKDFGCTSDGRPVKLYTIENRQGMKVKITNYGAAIVSILVPDQEGEIRDVALGYDSCEDYENNNSCFGATIGRNANRIHNASFMLDGICYQLDDNNNGNNLHAGFHGFQRVVWTVIYSEDCSQVSFWHESTETEQGFPGNMKVKVQFRVTEDNKLIINYEAKSDKKTIANMTNHTYFNLSGHETGSAMSQRVMIAASRYTPVGDSKAIPTGEIASVEGTPLDFRKMKEINKDIESDFEQLKYVGGYDHNFELEITKEKVRLAAKAESKQSGITMTIYTDCPGIQFYTGNGIGKQKGKNGVEYDNGSGYCFEPQYFPDAINQENFKSPILKHNEIYSSTSIYEFGIIQE